MSGGISRWIAASSFFTLSATATVLASGWRNTFSTTAGRPSAVTITYSGVTPGAIVATCDSRIGRPFDVPTATFASSSGVFTSPLTSTSASS